MDRQALHFGNIARSKGESVRPDLWADHVWCPALGIQGGTLIDLSSQKNASCSAPIWLSSKYGSVIDGNSSSTGMFLTSGNTYSWKQPWTTIVVASPDSNSTDQTAFACWDQRQGVYAGGWVIWYDVDGSYDGWSFAFSRKIADTLTYYRLVGTNTLSGAIGQYSVIISGWTGNSWFHYVDGVSITESTTAVDDPGYPGDQSGPISMLGRNQGSTPAHFMDGKVAFAGIFKRALPLSQILALTADPMLPLRRKKIWSMYVPSTGGVFKPYWLQTSKIIGAA